MSTFIDGDGICGKSGMMGIPVDIEIRSWAGYEGVAHRNGSVGGCDLALQRAVLGGDLGEFVTQRGYLTQHDATAVLSHAQLPQQLRIALLQLNRLHYFHMWAHDRCLCRKLSL